MTSFRKFIINLSHLKLNLEYINGSKNTQTLGYQLADVSDKKLDGQKWFELENNDKRLKSHNKKYDDYNIMFVSLHKNLCVIDTDGEQEYNVIYDYLQNICKFKMIENNITRSSYNFEVEDTNYKRHFWFELDSDEIFTNILGSKYGLKFDILFDKVFEHKQNYEIKNFQPLYIGINEINELLQYIDSKFNTQFNNTSNQKTNKNEPNNIQYKDINELIDYIECLNIGRYEYNNWRNVGFALHSAIDEYDEDDLINLYNDWSSKDKRPNKYKGLKEILSTWRNIKTISNGITLKSFYLWCKEDNEKLYNKIVSKYSTNNNQETIKEFNENSYNNLKNKIESEWFFNNYNCRYYRYYDNELILYNVRDTQQYFKNVFYPYKIKTDESIKTIHKSFFKDWSEDEKQRRYEKVLFNPDPNFKYNQKYYNEWKGWKWLNDDIDIDEDKIKPFIDLINYLCNDDDKVLEFILNWLSWIIQRPHKKTNTAICLYSDKHGVGKNTLIELIKRLFEGYTSKLSRIEDLGKNFNAHYDKKFFIYGDEIKATAKQWANEIKNMITETEKVIEKKGIDSQMNKCFVNYFFTTNNEINFQIEDSDRRWLLIECEKERMSSRQSQELYKCIEDDEYITHIFNYLYRRDISTIVLLEPPMTDYKQRLINQTLPGYIQYLYNNYRILANNKIYVDDFFKSTIDYSKQNHLSTLFSKDIVGKYLSKYDGIIFSKGRENKFGRYYEFYETNIIENFLKKENPSYFKNLDF